MNQVVDLRSDTVTQPTKQMRETMCAAKVGDDVYGEDPTVIELEEYCAEVLGKPASLFVPSGTMANQIAIRCHTVPGDTVLAGYKAHTFAYESGAAAALSGTQISILPGDGRFTADAVRSVFNDGANAHFPPTRLVTVENTHNMGGGILWPRAQLAAVLETSRALGMSTHLDGARLWNAAQAENLAESELTRGFDSVSVCLSKGLGAPVGSVLAGDVDFIKRAHRFRKMFGGGMRQAGILAAAGIFALKQNRERLSEDHENATYLARELNKVQGLSVKMENVQTNIVMVDIDKPELDANQLMERATKRGVRFGAIHSKRFRLVTHLDIDRSACGNAIQVITELS